MVESWCEDEHPDFAIICVVPPKGVSLAQEHTSPHQNVLSDALDMSGMSLMFPDRDHYDLPNDPKYHPVDFPLPLQSFHSRESGKRGGGLVRAEITPPDEPNWCRHSQPFATDPFSCAPVRRLLGGCEVVRTELCGVREITATILIVSRRLEHDSVS